MSQPQRGYTMTIPATGSSPLAISTSAVMDIVTLVCGSGNGLISGYYCLTSNLTSETETVFLRLKRLTTTVTVGSGGTAGTVQHIDDGDTKATTLTSVRYGDTTQATTTGTTQYLACWLWNPILPFEFLWMPENRRMSQVSEAINLETAAAAASAISVAGFVDWWEVP